MLRRLQLLYHHGFLERPRAQIDYYHRGGSREIVYGLGNKSATLLRPETGSTSRPVHWGAKNRSVGRLFLEHALLVSDVMVALELACRRAGHIRLLRTEEFSLPTDGERTPQPLRWKVKVNSQLKLGIVPDKVFALDSEEQSSNRNPAFFFLEADRGTMPVVRKNLSQSSFYRKLLAYLATWNQGVHRSRLGLHRFRVLTVTTSAERVKSLIDACSQLKSGNRLFLFTDLASFRQHSDILTMPWQTGRPGETASLLD